jgi:hypothetical protein
VALLPPTLNRGRPDAERAIGADPFVVADSSGLMPHSATAAEQLADDEDEDDSPTIR